MRSMVLCDGTLVEWTPEMVDNECFECGSVTSQRDVAEPAYHGPARWNDDRTRYQCTRCECDMGHAQAVHDAMVKRYAQDYIANVERESKLIAWIKGK